MLVSLRSKLTANKMLQEESVLRMYQQYVSHSHRPASFPPFPRPCHRRVTKCFVGVHFILNKWCISCQLKDERERCLQNYKPLGLSNYKDGALTLEPDDDTCGDAPWGCGPRRQAGTPPPAPAPRGLSTPADQCPRPALFPDSKSCMYTDLTLRD